MQTSFHSTTNLLVLFPIYQFCILIGLIKSLPGHAFRAGKLHPWITRIVCTWNRDKNLGMEKYTISSISGKNSTNQEKRLLIGGTYANVRSWDIRAKKRLRLFDRVHKDSKWQKLVSRGHYKDYWFIYLWGSFVETISLFTGGGEKGGRGRVGVRFMGRVVQHSSQILAFHLTSGGDKSPQPQQVQTLTFQPGCFIAGPTVVCARFFADYLELFPFPLLDGFSSEWGRGLLFKLLTMTTSPIHCSPFQICEVDFTHFIFLFIFCILFISF